jgi:hypothetical protein
MTRALGWVVTVVLFAGCGDSRDEVDAGRTDAGMRDAGMGGSDAGPRDAGGTNDAGAIDAGESDAGTTDAGAIDAGSNGGDTCEDAIDVTGGGTFTGTTTGATDDYSVSGPGCPTGGFASGEDVAYVVRPTAQTTYEIMVTPTEAQFDPMLYAVTTCGGSGCVEGVVLNGPNEPEQITLDVAADETVYVVVDGEVTTDGAYELSVVIQ